jgi:hypothetical protein
VAQGTPGWPRWPSRAMARGTVGYGAISGMWRSLVSAPALGAGGPGFKSRHPDWSGACRWVAGPSLGSLSGRLLLCQRSQAPGSTG